MVRARLYCFAVFLSLGSATAWGQTNLDIRRTGGTVTAAQGMQFLYRDSDWSPPGITDTNDTAASASGATSDQDPVGGPVAKANGASDAFASCSLATNATSPTATANAANFAVASSTVTDPAFSAACTATATSAALIQLVVEPDPLDPSVASAALEGILSVIGASSGGGVTATASTQNAAAACGRFSVTYVDALGTSTLTVLDGGNVVATYVGDSGANYLLHTVDIVAISTPFALQATGRTASGSLTFFEIGAGNEISSISTMATCEATGIPGGSPGPGPSVGMIVDEEFIPIPLE